MYFVVKNVEYCENDLGAGDKHFWFLYLFLFVVLMKYLSGSTIFQKGLLLFILPLSYWDLNFLWVFCTVVGLNSPYAPLYTCFDMPLVFSLVLILFRLHSFVIFTFFILYACDWPLVHPHNFVTSSYPGNLLLSFYTALSRLVLCFSCHN